MELVLILDIEYFFYSEEYVDIYIYFMVFLYYSKFIIYLIIGNKFFLMMLLKMMIVELRVNLSCCLLILFVWLFLCFLRFFWGLYVIKILFDVCLCIWLSIFLSYWIKCYLVMFCWLVRIGGFLCWKFMMRSGLISFWRKMLC